MMDGVQFSIIINKKKMPVTENIWFMRPQLGNNAPVIYGAERCMLCIAYTVTNRYRIVVQSAQCVSQTK